MNKNHMYRIYNTTSIFKAKQDHQHTAKIKEEIPSARHNPTPHPPCPITYTHTHTPDTKPSARNDCDTAS